MAIVGARRTDVHNIVNMLAPLLIMQRLSITQKIANHRTLRSAINRAGGAQNAHEVLMRALVAGIIMIHILLVSIFKKELLLILAREMMVPCYLAHQNGALVKLQFPLLAFSSLVRLDIP